MSTPLRGQNDDAVVVDSDLEAILHEQNQELASFSAYGTDLDLAFDLQLEEALAASLALVPSSSSSPPPKPQPLPPAPRDDTVSLQSLEISRLLQEINDRKLSQAEARRIRLDLERRVHDHAVAREIADIPESEWRECGDEYEDPFPADLGSGESVFRLYFKGLVGPPGPEAAASSSGAKVNNNKKNNAVGLGVAICDLRSNVVFEIRKPLVGMEASKIVAELKALIEGLNAAVALELKRIVLCFNCFPLYRLVTGTWRTKQRKVALLLDQASLLFRNFLACDFMVVGRPKSKHAIKLAQEALDSFAKGPALLNPGKTINETCAICSEDVDVVHMFSVENCKHRYCFSCMKQHVEMKLLHGVLPKCPHEGCKSDLGVGSCEKFLTPKLIETLRQRIKEASIPISERVYCPYPRCSVLMSKAEISEYAKKDASIGAEPSGATKCLKCHGLFCIGCKVPWHRDLTCRDYKRLNPNPPAEDVKLKNLATSHLWRQCAKCNHMIELAFGCFHMTCRCGHEFCYNCGAEWRNKKPTCSCPLWDEGYILSGEEDEDFEEDFEDEDEDDDDDYIDSDYDDYQ